MSSVDEAYLREGEGGLFGFENDATQGLVGWMMSAAARNYLMANLKNSQDDLQWGDTISGAPRSLFGYPVQINNSMGGVC